MNYELGQALIAETRRRIFEESYPRIETCLGMLSEQQIWQRPRTGMASVGNLVLHLCGNGRQWICSGLAGWPDNRDRNSEFAHEGGLSRAALIAHLDGAISDLARALDEVDPAALLTERPVQVYRETGLSILVHVIEHFSYHTGQITWCTKVWTSQDTEYYGGQDLTGKGG